MADIWVRGNCSMCKERIESTTKSLNGIQFASWDVDSKILHVTFDSTKVSLGEINVSIANVGHSTKLVARNESAHEALPNCCKEGSKGH
ncbi:MAG: cation transporter [Bacteroidota bacterium]|nr:cation transporter [Bacteroidota bacterium]